METDDEKENEVSPPTARKPPKRYSDKLSNLLTFLDEQGSSNRDDDSKDQLSINNNNDDNGEIKGASDYGLVDITNNSAAVASKSNRSQRKRRSSVGGEKKYVWDSWDHLSDKSLPNKPSTTTSITNESGLNPDLVDQLAELKLMSEQIQTRTTTMKMELEDKSNKVEHLHSIRVKNEALHIQKMKSVKLEWKKRLDSAKEDHDKVTSDQEELNKTLTKECNSFEKKIARLHLDIEKTVDCSMCESLRRDGSQALQDAKKSWAQTEKEEIKRREQRLSPKLKAQAAKAIEPKLRQLMERNKEMDLRLEREASRELDCYKLELYRMSNDAFRRQTIKIRDEERDRASHERQQWFQNLEQSRVKHENEMRKTTNLYAKRGEMMQQQFNVDKQECIDEHEEQVQRVEVEMKKFGEQHVRDMIDMDDEFANKLIEKQRSCEEEFKRWTSTKETELQAKQDKQLQEEQDKMKCAMESDINRVKQKLIQEKNEKINQAKHEVDEKIFDIKHQHDAETQRLTDRLDQATHEMSIFLHKDEGESRAVTDLQMQFSKMNSAQHEKKDQILSYEYEQKLAAFIQDSEEQMIEVANEGQRRVGRAKRDLVQRAEELNNLIDSRPQTHNDREKQLEELQQMNEDEILLAEAKIDEMLDSKRAVLEAASNKLRGLQQESEEIDRNLEQARRKSLSGKISKIRMERRKK